MNKNKILIYQPSIEPYRVNFFNNLSHFFKITILINKSNKYEKKLNKKILIKKIKKIELKFFIFQTNFLNKIKNINYVILQSDLKNVSWFFLLIVLKLKKIKCSLWGHGLFKKNLDNFFLRIIYKLIFKYYELFIDKYICYNDLVKKSLHSINFNKNKIFTLDNTLTKNRPFKFFIKKKSKNLLFIGRLRNRSKIEIIFKALNLINLKKKIKFKLFIIGDGENKNYLKIKSKKYQINVKFLGEIYDPIKIKNIANKCFAGVYPGDCGLSVVDYFYYGLPVVIHNQFNHHMGPEPNYVKNYYNGVFFKENNPLSMANKIFELYDNKVICNKISKNSFKTFEVLNKISMAEKIRSLILKTNK